MKAIAKAPTSVYYYAEVDKNRIIQNQGSLYQMAIPLGEDLIDPRTGEKIPDEHNYRVAVFAFDMNGVNQFTRLITKPAPDGSQFIQAITEAKEALNSIQNIDNKALEAAKNIKIDNIKSTAAAAEAIGYTEDYLKKVANLIAYIQVQPELVSKVDALKNAAEAAKKYSTTIGISWDQLEAKAAFITLEKAADALKKNHWLTDHHLLSYFVTIPSSK